MKTYIKSSSKKLAESLLNNDIDVAALVECPRDILFRKKPIISTFKKNYLLNISSSNDGEVMVDKTIIEHCADVISNLPNSILEIDNRNLWSNSESNMSQTQTIMCDPNASTVVVDESEDLHMASDDEMEYHQSLNIINDNIIKLPSNIEDWLLLQPEQMNVVFSLLNVDNLMSVITNKEICTVHDDWWTEINSVGIENVMRKVREGNIDAYRQEVFTRRPKPSKYMTSTPLIGTAQAENPHSLLQSTTIAHGNTHGNMFEQGTFDRGHGDLRFQSRPEIINDTNEIYDHGISGAGMSMEWQHYNFPSTHQSINQIKNRTNITTDASANLNAASRQESIAGLEAHARRLGVVLDEGLKDTNPYMLSVSEYTQIQDTLKGLMELDLDDNDSVENMACNAHIMLRQKLNSYESSCRLAGRPTCANANPKNISKPKESQNISRHTFGGQGATQRDSDDVRLSRAKEPAQQNNITETPMRTQTDRNTSRGGILNIPPYRPPRSFEHDPSCNSLRHNPSDQTHQTGNQPQHRQGDTGRPQDHSQHGHQQHHSNSAFVQATHGQSASGGGGGGGDGSGGGGGGGNSSDGGGSSSGGDDNGSNRGRGAIANAGNRRGRRQSRQSRDGSVAEAIQRLVALQEGQVRAKQDNISYASYCQVLRGLLYFSGQPTGCTKNLPSAAKNNIETDVIEWARSFQSLVKIHKFSPENAINAFFDRLVGTAAETMSKWRNEGYSSDALVDTLLTRFYTQRDISTVIDEMNNIQRRPGEYLAMFVNRIEKLVLEYRKVCYKWYPKMAQEKTFEIFCSKVLTGPLKERMKLSGCDGSDMDTVIRIAQDHFDTHVSRPWAVKHVNKELIDGADPFNEEMRRFRAKGIDKKSVKNASNFTKFDGNCHLCDKKGHKAVDCLSSGKYQHLRPVRSVVPTEQNLGKKCTWCNIGNHSSYECNIYEKVQKHVQNKQMRGLPSGRIGGFNNRGDRGYSARGQSFRGYSGGNYPNNGYSVRGDSNRASRGYSNRGNYRGRGRNYQNRSRGGRRVFNITTTESEDVGEEDTPGEIEEDEYYIPEQGN